MKSEVIKATFFHIECFQKVLIILGDGLNAFRQGKVAMALF